AVSRSGDDVHPGPVAGSIGQVGGEGDRRAVWRPGRPQLVVVALGQPSRDAVSFDVDDVHLPAPVVDPADTVGTVVTPGDPSGAASALLVVEVCPLLRPFHAHDG